MAYTRRKYSSDIKSLLHFDYPYFMEPGDGCRDEISGETWTRSSSSKFAGAEIPADKINTNTPKFGYRCLETGHPDGIYSTNVSGIFSLNPDKEYEFELFFYPTQFASAYEIFSILSKGGENRFILRALNDGSLVITCVKWGKNGSKEYYNCTKTLTLNQWNHILVRIREKNIYIYINGLLASQSKSAISGGALEVTNCVLAPGMADGSPIGYIDEFIFRHSAKTSAPVVPTAPCQGTLDFKAIGGFGDGKHGAVTISKDTQINAYSRVTAITGTSVTHSGWKNGSIEPQVGCEVMFLVTEKTAANAEEHLGCYAFRKITALNTTTTFTIDNEISTEFPGSDCAKNYVVQAILMPNFTTLNITAGKIVPLTYNTNTGGGIIAFRAKENVTLSGSGAIISHTYGPPRTDLQQVCHANLIDKFICNKGGGIYIVCGDTFTAGSANRIGATWDGSVKGGQGAKYNANTNGGAGYGGGGAGDKDSGGIGGHGGVGGGGGGSDAHQGGNAGADGNYNTSKVAIGTGGIGAQYSGSSPSHDPGTQGKTPGGNAKGPSAGGSGGGAGGIGGSSIHGARGGFSGANLVLITRKLKVDAAAISTGGERGYSDLSAGGGGGTGFCYIACEEMN